ncbi:class I SAM-dependent methyltransferase [Streptomyces virens]|uniref:Class I SAM-dependent methyltransferase n=1 Tax=Streptomyces virens TaxID=285572 RepID=A0ABP6P231_9ACTN|nr:MULTISPECIES: class I SAM-dependent methyltransferase [Streptomyces]MBA8974021.1 SAM-dependent methyltransferase [Streptomyces calvus]MYS29887.1 methyltransferase domain-containing protein [Streptomyces sp. SID7804]
MTVPRAATTPDPDRTPAPATTPEPSHTPARGTASASAHAPAAAHAPAPTPAPDHIATTRSFYDAIAEDYAGLFRDLLAAMPLDRALLAGFAELVGPGGRVADLGCGPGSVTAHLASLGLSVFGVDLSEGMLAIARRENPGLRFEQGSMLDLDIPDDSLAGAVSYYSTIHLPDEELPAAFAEFRRVLAPGGHLVVAFQVGDEPRHHHEPFGHPVSLDFLRRRPEPVAALLEAAGFTVVLRSVRAADAELGEPTPQAFLIARAPRTGTD